MVQINYTYLLINIIITAFCYMIYPMIVHLSNNELDIDKAKKIALWNSIIVGFSFLVLNVALYDEPSYSGAPVLYYFINLYILKRNKNNRKNTNKGKHASEVKDEIVSVDFLKNAVIIALIVLVILMFINYVL